MAGMLIAVAPVTAAAVAGFVLLNYGVLSAFQDITDRQRTEIVPAQRVNLSIWDAANALDEFVESQSLVNQSNYREERSTIEADLAGLIGSVGDDPASKALALGAQRDWQSAASVGNDLLSVRRPADDPDVVEQVEKFDGAVRAASDKLETLIERLEADIGIDQQNADRAYERALWLAAIAAGVCLLAMGSGVLLIGRVMSASVDRLVDGAHRFAEGERSHRIDVQIPPELRRVADEFNRMITKIHAFEDILSERALEDVLTGLPNRRAFDEAMVRNWSRVQQFGDQFSIVLLDVDHFKRVNDTYGHGAGDDVLRSVARTIADQLRAAHPAFRTGGEEFAVIVPNSSVSEAQVVAERLRAAVRVTAVPVPGGEVNVSVSAGVADSRGATGNDEMFRAADAALYRAKTLGRDRVVTTGDDRVAGVSAA